MQEKSVLQNFIGSKAHNNIQNILPHNWFEEGGLSGVLLNRGKECSIKFHMYPNIDSWVKRFAFEKFVIHWNSKWVEKAIVLLKCAQNFILLHLIFRSAWSFIDNP